METVHDHHSYDEAAVHVGAEPNRHASLPLAMLTTVARLRAFAILLCMNLDLAERLVAITLVRAGVAIRPSGIGPILSTWLFSRLRQYYYRECAAGSEPSAPSRYARHGEVLAALAELTAEQRESLVLVEAAGCSRREAAQICRCTPIQFRNRLADAQDRLARAMLKPSPRRDGTPPISVAFAVLTGSRGMTIDRHHS
jgi:RNA polymerase sigma-70 factor, ECF subfamily